VPRDAPPPAPSQQWVEFTDRLILARDAARAEVTALKAELESEEAKAQHWRNQHDILIGVMRNIVNNPTSQRTQVQSQLLIAIERHGG
jgi:hypothetical protein